MPTSTYRAQRNPTRIVRDGLLSARQRLEEHIEDLTKSTAVAASFTDDLVTDQTRNLTVEFSAIVNRLHIDNHEELRYRIRAIDEALQDEPEKRPSAEIMELTAPHALQIDTEDAVTLLSRYGNALTRLVQSGSITGEYEPVDGTFSSAAEPRPGKEFIEDTGRLDIDDDGEAVLRGKVVYKEPMADNTDMQYVPIAQPKNPKLKAKPKAGSKAAATDEMKKGAATKTAKTPSKPSAQSTSVYEEEHLEQPKPSLALKLKSGEKRTADGDAAEDEDVAQEGSRTRKRRKQSPMTSPKQQPTKSSNTSSLKTRTPAKRQVKKRSTTDDEDDEADDFQPKKKAKTLRGAKDAVATDVNDPISDPTTIDVRDPRWWMQNDYLHNLTCIYRESVDGPWHALRCPHCGGQASDGRGKKYLLGIAGMRKHEHDKHDHKVSKATTLRECSWRILSESELQEMIAGSRGPITNPKIGYPCMEKRTCVSQERACPNLMLQEWQEENENLKALGQLPVPWTGKMWDLEREVDKADHAAAIVATGADADPDGVDEDRKRSEDIDDVEGNGEETEINDDFEGE